MTTKKVDEKNREDTAEEYIYTEDENVPEAYFIFDPRGEFHGMITNSAISVKKGDQFEYMMGFAGDLGQVEMFDNTAVVKDVDEQKAKAIFQQKDYFVVEATETDFAELAREADKLETIKGDEDYD